MTEVDTDCYLEDCLHKLRLCCLGNTGRYDRPLVSEGRGWERGKTVHRPPDDNLSWSGLLLHRLLSHINCLHCGGLGDDLRHWGHLHLHPSVGRDEGQVGQISRVAGPALPGVAVASQLEWEPVGQPGLENIQGSSEREDAEILDQGVSQVQAGHLDHYQGRQELRGIISS